MPPPMEHIQAIWRKKDESVQRALDLLAAANAHVRELKTRQKVLQEDIDTAHKRLRHALAYAEAVDRHINQLRVVVEQSIAMRR